MPNPSIVMAAFDDKELQASIKQMVANFDKGLQDMLDHTNKKVGEIQQSLQKIGNTNFGSTGSNDGGISKQTKAQNEFTDAVKKSTNEIKRQGKEGEMSFDQIAAALDKARRTVSEFNTKRASGMLPSSEDYKKYEQALARIVEFNDKLKQSALAMADANQKAFAFDGKHMVKDAFNVDERLKGLNRWYSSMEKKPELIPQEYAFEIKNIENKLSSLKSRLQNAKDEFAQLGKKVEDESRAFTVARDRIIQYKQAIREHNATIQLYEYQVASGREVDAFDKYEYDKAKEKVKELKEELQKLWNERFDIPAPSKADIDRYNELKHKITETQKEVEKYENSLRSINGQQQTTQSAQRYTEEIRKQAAAIRATKEWKEQGIANVNGHVFYDAERVKGTKQHIREIGTLEEQILRSMQQQSIAERVNTQEAQQRLDTIKRIAAAARAEMKQYGTSGYNTGYAVQNPYIYAENDARAKGLTIEQQIANVLRENEASYQASARSAAMVVEEEKKITQEQDKRKSYKAPVSAIDESFKQLTANALGVQPSEIESASTKISKMTTYVRQLETAYSNLTRQEQRSPFGKQLREEIQTTSRVIQQFRSEITRPINLQAALQGSEKTLDDIAYKMQRLSSYRSGLNIETQKSEIDQVNRKYAELQKKMNEVMQKNQQMIASNTALGRSWNYMKNRLAFYFSVGASTQFVKNLIEVRSQYEMNERALGILINSAERGTQIFNELSQMSLVSPYTLIELSSAAKQLTAYDIAARDVVDTTRRLADMASAVGVPIERLTYALGQIKAYGYLNSRDQRMFANAGIPLAGELAKYYTEIEGRLVSTGDVYDRIKKKAVDYNTVMQVMYRMTDEGGKFFDFQAKMADTLKVRLANLTLAWNNMLNDIGKESQGVLTWGIGALRTLFLHWKELDKLINNVAWIVGLRTAFMLLTYGVLKLGGALGVTTKQMALSAVVGKRLAGVLRTVGGAMNNLAMSKVTWFLVLAEAAWEAGNMIFRANQSTVELNKSLREGAETNFKDISEYLSQYQKVADSLYSGKKTNNAYDLRTGKVESEASTPTNINVDEANKAWEAMRERIELSTAASDAFVGRLLTIENVSERLRQGFILLNDIQQVNSAMKDMGDTAIVVTQDWSKLWNIWAGPDGLIDNLGDVQDELDDVVKKFGSLAEARKLVKEAEDNNTWSDLQNKAWRAVRDYDNDWETLKGDIDKTTESLNNFIRNMGFASNPDQVAEAYAQVVQKISAEKNLDPQRAYILQQGVEEARGKAMKEALEARIADEEHALKLARDNETKASLSASIQRHEAQLELFTKYTDDQRAEWERFTKYMKENHISEMQAMFGQMDEEQISHINWQEGKYLDFVKRTAAAYAKRHNMAYKDVFNRLWGLINKTNLMQIFLKLTISTEGQKSLYETLKAGDERINQIDTEIERLKKISSLSSNYAQAQTDIVNLEKERTELKAKDAISSKEEKDAAKAAKDAARGRKTADAAARKAQREAESELQKALKDEIQLIDKARSTYKALVKEAVDSQTAISIAVSGWDETIEHINKVLGKYGIDKLDLTKFAGVQNPRAVMDMLQAQLDKLTKSGVAKPSEIKDLQVKLKDLKVDSITFDQKTIADSLNNKLSVLNDEYELAVTLDADPELGNAFADMMGINMDALPHTVKEYADRYAQYLNKYLKDNKSTLQFTGDELFRLTKDDIDAFHEQAKAGTLNPEWFDRIKKGYDDISSKRKKDTEDASKNWDKLLQKYAEYEYKIKEIENQSNRERKALIDKFGTEEQKARSASIVAKLKISTTAEERLRLKEQLKSLVNEVTKGDEAKVNLSVAIDNKEAQGTAKLSFEEFQKSATWITALGDVSDMTSKALSYLRESLQDYLRTADKLDGKSVQKLQKAIRNLDKEMKKRNPFKAFSVASIEAKERAEQYNTQIADVQSQIDAYHKREEEGIELTEEEQEEYEQLVEKLRMLKEEQKAVGQIDASAVIKSLQGIISMARQAVTEFQELAQAIGGKGMTDAAKNLNDVVTILEKGGQGAAIGAQIGGGYGAIIGAAAGVLSGLVTTQMDRWTGNKSISRRVEESEREIKRLENAYIDLEEATNRAFGAAVVGAKQAELANKKLQLAELERQLQLEKSRKKKNKDQDKIIDLERQIKELRYEISQGYTDIVNDLLGVSSAADFAENLVSSMIDAFRKGEDYMKTFQESFEEMVDNMIMKSIVAKIVAYYINGIWDALEKRITERSKEEADAYAKAQAKNTEIQDDWSDYDIRKYLLDQRRASMSFDDWKSLYMQYGGNKGLMYDYITDEDVAAFRAMYQSQEDAAKAALDAASAIDDGDIQWLNAKLEEIMPTLGEQLQNIIGQYYTFGDKSQKELSALQQGIQGITEDTAGALEAYMNGVSQQVYYQSTLLEQIRDTIVGFDLDVSLGVQAQMLLQLQQSYQTQQAIQQILEGVLVPSGRAFAVELLS